MKNKKFIYKILSVILTVSITVSMFVVPASAEAITLFVIGGLIGLGIGTAVNLISQSSDSYADDVSEWWDSAGGVEYRNNLTSLYNKDDVIQIHLDENDIKRAVINPNYSYTSDELVLLNAVIGELNNDIDKYVVIPSGDYRNSRLTSLGYSMMKEKIVNTILEEANRKCLEDINQNIFELRDIVGGFDQPYYTFDFVGPLPSFNGVVPFRQNYSALTTNGITFSPPAEYGISQQDLYNLYFNSVYFTCGSTSKVLNFKSGFQDISRGHYVIDGGKVYVRFNNGFLNGADHINYGDYYYDISTGLPCSIPFSNSYRFGLWTNLSNSTFTRNNLTSGASVEDLSDDSFIKTTGGDFTHEVPRTAAENAVGAAITAGLISESDPLTIDDQGNIVAANDIPIAQLQELIDKIQAGSLDLENIEQYLNLISTLVANGNLTSSQQKAILDGINSNILSQGRTLTDINDGIREISEALTKEYEYDLDHSDNELNWLEVDHTGLTEAQAIVNNVPIVNQTKQLINNLFGRLDNSSNLSRSGDNPPTFSFYWDSNKDGITEKYTVLDLSFLEFTLTNNNIDDYRRFQTPMTVREFIHLLIIFLAYASFAFKLLKIFPSLITGTGDAVNNYKFFS